MIDYSAVESQAPDGWFSQYDIAVLIPEVQKLRPGESYVELGTNRGRSFWVARKFSDPAVKIIGFDTMEDPQVEGTIFYREDSAEGAKRITGVVNLIFIDADHGYESVKLDIAAWYPKMALGAVMLFHDYDEATSPEVVRAVNEFLEKYKLKIETFGPDRRCSMGKVQL